MKRMPALGPFYAIRTAKWIRPVQQLPHTGQQFRSMWLLRTVLKLHLSSNSTTIMLSFGAINYAATNAIITITLCLCGIQGGAYSQGSLIACRHYPVTYLRQQSAATVAFCAHTP